MLCFFGTLCHEAVLTKRPEAGPRARWHERLTDWANMHELVPSLEPGRNVEGSWVLQSCKGTYRVIITWSIVLRPCLLHSRANRVGSVWVMFKLCWKLSPPFDPLTLFCPQHYCIFFLNPKYDLLNYNLLEDKDSISFISGFFIPTITLVFNKCQTILKHQVTSNP